MMPKTKLAFQFTAEYLFERGNVYFWTFTFKKAVGDREIGKRWHLFQRDIIRLWHGNIGGLRVFEVHPGGHGLHVHLLVNRRVSIHEVLRLTRRHHTGRVGVRKAVPGDSEYLSKYLAKDGPPLAKGIRRWQTFGILRRVPVRGIIVESSEANHIRLNRRANPGKISWAEFRRMVGEARLAGFKDMHGR